MSIVGILKLQGDFDKHAHMVRALGYTAHLIRTSEELKEIDACIIPGGESTTIGKLMNTFGMIDPLRERILAGLPVYGTCAGLILLAPNVPEKNQHRLDVLDIDVERNAYGRQVDSFEADIPVPIIGGDPVRGVFIRAPLVTRIGKSVEVLASFEKEPVLLRQGNILGSSFHPELTDDKRIHKYFLEVVCRNHQ